MELLPIIKVIISNQMEIMLIKDRLIQEDLNLITLRSNKLKVIKESLKFLLEESLLILMKISSDNFSLRQELNFMKQDYLRMSQEILRAAPFVSAKMLLWLKKHAHLMEPSLIIEKL